ncbi:Cell division and transport-associated protein TolR [Desulfocurvibacter africanus PCS]|uniref:Cell division and transport-associated protein TolR n=1 Tax=Desulfocurvibacter africanus PCS TaxID=1262666 RepID=M5Q1Y6_DESAF|nr:biopolymer transporter ExbD [Desulfocurvibacter africanus]EMG37971.1 Cell division and transport-associated protein TolR [Desulfocurvibacter africanus PCS]
MENRNSRRSIPGINITPLVDVMMVLLCIVFVTAPLMTQGVEVELPQTRTVAALPTDSEHLVLSIDKTGRVFIEEYEVKMEELKERLESLVAKQKKALYLKADAQVPYGSVVRVMGEIKAAGIDKLGMVAEEPETKGKKRK